MYFLQTTANKYQGLQNYFFHADAHNTQELQFLNLQTRRKLRQHVAGKPGMCARVGGKEY